MNKLLQLTFAFLIMIGAASLSAQELGDIDNSFGSDGFAYTNFEDDSAEYLNDVIVDQNNKIVFCGTIIQSGGNDILVARLNSNGSTDLNFGDGGYWTYDIQDGSADQAHAMLELSDEKLILVGSSLKNGVTKGFIMRLNKDGSLDQSFGEGSKGYTFFNAGNDKSCRPRDIELFQNSFYIAASVSTDDEGTNFGLFKFSASGALVTSFASSGSNLIDIKGSDQVTSLDVGDDGSFIIGGVSYANNIQYGAIVKLNQFGLKTSTFDGAGYFVYNEGSGLNTIMDVKYDNQGRIVAIGSEGQNPDRNGMIFRFSAQGVPDETFGTDGVMGSDIGTMNGVYLNSLFVDKDDQIICTGSLSGQSYDDVYVLKLTEKGTAHPDFGTKGDVNYELGLTPTYIHFKSAAMQADGNLVIAGTTALPNHDAYNVTVARVMHWEDEETAGFKQMTANQMTVYPNPATTELNINFEEQIPSTVELWDVYGRKVCEWNLEGSAQKLSIPSDVSSGTYFLKTILDNALYSARVYIE